MLGVARPPSMGASSGCVPENRPLMGDTIRLPRRHPPLVPPMDGYPMSEREKRVATNEALVRDVNERLESRAQVIVGEDAPFAAVCECADPECTDRIALTPIEYEDAHGDERQFIVVPAHVAEDVEDVVQRNETFFVVRKRGLAGEIAAELD